MRPAPRISPSEIVAGVWLNPNCAHQLEVAVPSGVVAMKFDRDQVAQLKEAIAEFETVVTFDDGGSDRHHAKFIPLRTGR